MLIYHNSVILKCLVAAAVKLFCKKSDVYKRQTNTFASNTYSLDCSIEQVKENIKAAYKIAKEAVEQSGKEIFIAEMCIRDRLYARVLF